MGTRIVPPAFKLIGVCCVVACAFFAAAAETSPGASDVRDFAVSLIRNGVPTGVIVPEQDFAPTQKAHPARPPARRAATTTQDLNTSLAAFNAGNRRSRASLNRDVVHLRSVDEPEAVRNLLQRQMVVASAGEISVFDAVFKVIVGGLRGWQPEGIAGVGPLPDPSCGLDRHLRLTTRSASVFEVLDELAKSAPGVAWVATYRPKAVYEGFKLGVLCPDGTSLKMPVFDE